MKKFTLLLTAGIFAFSFNGFSQIKVNSTGKVGINNTSPTYQLDVAGTFRINDSGNAIVYQWGQFYSTSYCSLGDYSNRWSELFAVSPTFTYTPDIDSDESFKTDIRDFSDVSAKVNQLRAVKYKLAPERIPQKEGKPLTDNGDLYGFIAQEVQAIFPEIVTTRKDGTHGIRYTELVPVLVKAFQEQQTEIEDLKARIRKLETAGK